MKYSKRTKLTALAAIGSASVAAVVIGCGSGGGSPATTVNATSVLKSDGYSPLGSEPQTTIAGTFGSDAQYISSAAAGANDSGNLEIVVVFGKAGGQGALNAVKPQLDQAITGSGLTDSSSGLALKVAGSHSAFAAAGLGG